MNGVNWVHFKLSQLQVVGGHEPWQVISSGNVIKLRLPSPFFELPRPLGGVS